MAPKYLYICGVCNQQMKATAPSIGCIACCNWIHVKCANLKYKEDLHTVGSYVTWSLKKARPVTPNVTLTNDRTGEIPQKKKYVYIMKEKNK